MASAPAGLGSQAAALVSKSASCALVNRSKCFAGPASHSADKIVFAQRVGPQGEVRVSPRGAAGEERPSPRGSPGHPSPRDKPAPAKPTPAKSAASSPPRRTPGSPTRESPSPPSGSPSPPARPTLMSKVPKVPLPRTPSALDASPPADVDEFDPATFAPPDRRDTWVRRAYSEPAPATHFN